MSVRGVWFSGSRDLCQRRAGFFWPVHSERFVYVMEVSAHQVGPANLTGRPVDICVDFMTRDTVLTDDEALEEGVVDFVAKNASHLLSGIDRFKIHGALSNGSQPRVNLSDIDQLVDISDPRVPPLVTIAMQASLVFVRYSSPPR